MFHGFNTIYAFLPLVIHHALRDISSFSWAPGFSEAWLAPVAGPRSVTLMRLAVNAKSLTSALFRVYINILGGRMLCMKRRLLDVHPYYGRFLYKTLMQKLVHTLMSLINAINNMQANLDFSRVFIFVTRHECLHDGVEPQKAV